MQDKFAAVDCVSLLSKFITVGEGTSTTVDLWRTLEVAECQSGIKACRQAGIVDFITHRTQRKSQGVHFISSAEAEAGG